LKENYYFWKHTRIKNVVLFTNVRKKEILEQIVEDRAFLNRLQVERGKDYNLIFERTVQANHSAGIISAPYKRRFLFFHNISLKRFFEQETPFLVPRLSFPYRKVLVSLNNEYPAGIVEQVFEIFNLFKVEKLTFVHVEFPEVLVSTRARENLSKALNLIEEYTKLYTAKDRVEILRLEGNPKKETLKLVPDYDLLIVGFEKKKVGILEPYTPYLLTKESKKSVLGIPSERAEVET